jgi:hypothetical protein
MNMPECPPGFIVRTELQKASFDNGFRIDEGTTSGWMHYRSATAPGEIWLAGAWPHGPWFLALSLCAVAQELGLPVEADRTPAHGVATFAFPTLEELHRALDRTYRLSVSLPDAPLQQFLSETFGVPRSTEAPPLLGRPLPADWNYRPATAPRLAHRSLGRVPDRRPPPRRPQRPAALGSLGCRL